MKLRFHSLWRVLPVPVITLKRMPGRIVGLCLGPVVLIREDYASDWPTIAHELAHCRQFWRGLALLHLARYYLSTRYRLHSEVEAFRIEIDETPHEHRQQRISESARALATCYGLDADVDVCRMLLSMPYLDIDDAFDSPETLVAWKSRSGNSVEGAAALMPAANTPPAQRSPA